MDPQSQRQQLLNAPIVLRQTYHYETSLKMYAHAPHAEPLLDVGCGSGFFTHWLTRHRGRAIGVDLTADFIEAARDRYGIEAYVMSVADLAFEDASFAAVCADNVLEHCLDPVGSFLEIRRVLRPGGFLLALIPPDALNPSELTLAHVWKPSIEEIAAVATSTGFEVETLETWDTWADFGFVYPPSGDRVTFLKARKPETDSEFCEEQLDRLRASLRSKAEDHVAREKESKEFRAGLRFRRGRDLFAEGRFAESREAYAMALAINPSFKEAYFELGRSWEAEGMVEEAIAQYRWLLERLNRDHAAARLRLASCLAHKGDRQAASQELRHLQRFNPDVPLPAIG
jgi:SAM-dependent methyltransferase